MPEIKNSFLKGKMNKDLDERLVPNGEYRDALNIEVSTSEGSSVGVVKNILGNHRIDSLVSEGFTCVGSIENEKTNKLYWFVSSYNADVIVEHDVDNDASSYIFIDTHAGTPRAVLKFPQKIITGISIIDDLLLWTDNVNDPRKINIEECKKGTIQTLPLNHTQLIFDKGSFNGITIDLITGSVDGNGDSVAITDNSTFPFSRVKYDGERVWFERKQLDALLGETAITPGFALSHDNTTIFLEHKVKHYRDGQYVGLKNIIVFDDPVLSSSNGTYLHAVDDFTSLTVIHDAWEVGDIIFGNDVKVDIEERHITVIKQKPLNAPSVKINHSEDVDSISSIPNLFETKLPRFSYRYKYRDGEFSPFAPFTHPVFNAKYPKDTSVSNDTNIFYNKDNAYAVEEPYNKAMVNSIHSIELTDFVALDMSEDVVEIEILYKQEESPIIYSIKTIKHSHKDWHTSSNYEGKGLNIGLGKSSTGTYRAQGGLTKGKYTVTTENIYAALPANQLLRPWDNVPKKALAQEVTGNRIVYGNYVQNYDLGEDTEVSVSYSDRKTNIGSFETRGLQHVKSQRNYQVGVVYSDKYGRETPVLTSTDGAVNIPWKGNNGNNNASRSLQLSASVTNNFPEWVDSFKFFIKETSNPYYNLVMDRAWVTKSTYELDDSKGNIWISFPSSDRNKVSEEDYIILKKKIGTGEEQVPTENKFKIIDIQNNAPDAIKYQLVNYGQLDQVAFGATDDGDLTTPITTNTGTDYLTEEVFIDADQRIDKEVDTIKMDVDGWKEFTNSESALFGGVPIEDDVDQAAKGPIRTSGLYISWRRLDTDGKGVSSKKYKITNGKFDSNYTFKLATKITKIDADIAHRDGNSATTTTTSTDANGVPSLHPDLIVQIERKERKDGENFSGKFFVKISKNQVTDLIDSGNPVNVLDQFQVTSKTASWYWQDDIGTLATVDIATSNNEYGLTNYHGHPADLATDPEDSIQNTANNNAAGDGAANGGTDDGSLRVTDWYSPWEGINEAFGPTFFIDSMHMAAGQSEASNYAKYSCVTWSGCTSGESDSAEDSSWSYPPLKTWITDFEDQAGLKKKLKSNSIWFNDDLISTSPLVDPQDDWRNKKVDGWVGPLQRPKRDTPTDADAINANHINGLEGIVTTVDDHAVGPRRWFSGMTSDNTEHGVGNDTKVYSNDGEVGRHFMHLSFFAPGKDLHTGTFKDANPTLFGSDSWAANLQGIWGGGVFGGGSKNKKFGTPKVHRHIMMEGNHDSNNNYRYLSPRPGVGAGYDLKYRELHARQWDPTFSGDGEDTDNKIRDFIRNLHPGAQFRFNKVSSGSADTVVYTIKKVSVKKLYNHTSWRKAYNRYSDADGYSQPSTEHKDYKSVEQIALEYLDILDGDGVATDLDTASLPVSDTRDRLMDKIKQFGAAHNRRICYIIELDKSPTDSATNGGFNPLDASENIMSADFAGNNFCDIEFLDPVKSVLLSDLSKFPAIWELDPKKQEVDLDIYYEASNNLPVKINDRTNELFAPIGCRVEVLNSTITSASILQSWDDSTATFYPGFPKYDDEDVEIDYSNLSFKFIREDGGYTVAEVEEYPPDGAPIDFKTEFKFKENIGENIVSGLSWYNSFSFGNGIESNRIKDDFNAIYISNGVKASTTTQEIYEEEHKAHSLIYSGVYNSNSSVNDLNQFIMAEKTTKDLNPTFGSIQKLFQRRISLIAFCEDRVVSIVSNKDTIYNADGNPQLIASDRVLGDANPFSGNYGISKNPESFARESFRTYFTDKQRGAVLRLSKDGLTPISKNGMHDWFRDNLTEYNSLIGTYDSYKEDYNLTLSNNSFSQNVLQDAYIEAGGDPVSITDASNRIENPTPVGNPFAPVHSTYNVLDTVAGPGDNPFVWLDFTADSYDLIGSATITNHAEITVGALQAYVAEIGTVPIGATSLQYDRYDNLPNSGATYNGTFWDLDDFSALSTWDDNEKLEDQHFLDTNIKCKLTPVYSQTPNTSASSSAEYYWDIQLPTTNWSTQESERIVRAKQGSNGWLWSGNTMDNCIVFDRCHPTTYLEFSDFGGQDANGDLTGDLNDTYRQDLILRNDPEASNIYHSSFFNGDELMIEFDVIHYQTGPNDTSAQSWKSWVGRNHCAPLIEFYDGQVAISADKFATINSCNVPKPSWTNNSYFQDSLMPNVVYEGTNHGIDKNTYPNNPWRSHEFWGGVAAPTDPYANPTYIHSTSYANSPSWGFQDQTGVNDGTSSVVTKWAEGNSVQFSNPSKNPTHSTTHPFQELHPHNYGGTLNMTRKYTVLMKFQDPNQNDNSQAQTAVKVIEDFRVRLSQTVDHGGTWSVNHSNNGYPLWVVKSFKMRKVKGIVHADLPSHGTITQIEIPPVPPVTIPAWNEVSYNHFEPSSGVTTWTIVDDAIGTGNVVITEAETQPYFGDDYNTDLDHLPGYENPTNSIDPNTGSNYLPTDPLNNGALIEYSIPEGFDIVHDQSGDHGPSNYSIGTNTYTGTVGAGTSGGFAFDRTTSSNGNTYGGTLVPHTNLYIDITSDAIDSATDITHEITGETYEVGEWYLVDVEFDGSVNANTGGGSGNGELMVYGVASTGNFDDGVEIDSNGVGEYAGDNTNAHCKLALTQRVEYGTPDGSGDDVMVLRGIFKVATDSYITPNELDKFVLRVVGCTNKIRINKIIVKKLSGETNSIASAGSLSDWISDGNSQYTPAHSFSDSSLFFSNDQLCWQIPSDGFPIAYANIWSQDIIVPEDIYKTAWSFKFTVDKNPITDSFSGNISGTVGVAVDGSFRAMAFKDIEEEGNYMISFDLKDYDDQDTASWKIYREDIGVVVDEGSDEYTGGSTTNDLVSLGWGSSTAGNKIQFHNTLGGTSSQQYGISNIELIPLEQTILTGSIGSWNIVGFDSTNPIYELTGPPVYLDNINNRFIFNDCPIAENASLQFININQQIGQNIKQGEQYKINFTYYIPNGEIGVYYYNNDNQGFKITDISGSATPSNFQQNITIGDDTWDLVQEDQNGVDYSTYNPDLKNCLVVVARNNGSNIKGLDTNADGNIDDPAFIDNLSMVRVYVDDATADKTITFNEAVNGWSSFKSFVPENGVSLSKKYFTFKNGGLWQHYIPKLQGSTGIFNNNFFIKTTVEEADNYNEFYGVNNYSSIQAVVNPEPSTVKVFNTINYEGSQAYISNPSAGEITISNAAAWSSGGDILGWECSEIKTNLDSGSVIEFIEKEGKWFNYIKGLGANQALDTSRFSVQGIGVVSSTQSVTFTQPSAGSGGGGGY